MWNIRVSTTGKRDSGRIVDFETRVEYSERRSGSDRREGNRNTFGYNPEELNTATEYEIKEYTIVRAK